VIPAWSESSFSWQLQRVAAHASRRRPTSQLDSAGRPHRDHGRGIPLAQANLYYAGNGATNNAIITIASCNVTLDFAGHYISGPSSNSSTQLYGVYANEEGNLNIQNGTIAFCAVGVYLNGNGSSSTLNINQRVQNMLISYCYQIGIELNAARNSDVFNKRISFIGNTSQSLTIGIFYPSTNNLEFGNINGNEVNTVTATATGNIGIFCENCFATNNRISECTTGIYGGKYQNNLTFGCTTNVIAGIDAGGNN
jgi:hypothetical protein